MQTQRLEKGAIMRITEDHVLNKTALTCHEHKLGLSLNWLREQGSNLQPSG